MPSTTATSRVSRRGAITKRTPKISSPPQMQRSNLRKRAESLLRDLQEEEQRGILKVARTAPPTTDKDDQEQTSLCSSTWTRTPSRKTSKKPQGEEKRLRKFRAKPPSTFLTKLERARTQRMVVLGRKRGVSDGSPFEEIDVVGSTGNVYQVTVTREPVCTCPDSFKGNECKHKVYALHTVLKAPAHLQYQLALLRAELEEIFAHAPPIPTEDCSATDMDGKRKPTDGECPICYMDLDPEHNKLIWCKAQCGHNMHKSCFNQWAASRAGSQVSCVYCRTPWDIDVRDAAAVKAAGEYGAEGYINVADHFGMSRARDYSGYYQPWARRHFGPGW